MRPFLFLFLLSIAAAPAVGHVLPHFSVFEIERKICIEPGQIRIVHQCRLRHDGADQIVALADADCDSTASERELTAFYLQAARFLAEDTVVMGGGPARQAKQEVFKVLGDENGFLSELVAPHNGDPGEVQILDPAFIVPAKTGYVVLPTIVETIPEVTAALPGSNDEATTAPSTFRTILRLTATTSGTLNGVSHSGEGVSPQP